MVIKINEFVEDNILITACKNCLKNKYCSQKKYDICIGILVVLFVIGLSIYFPFIKHLFNDVLADNSLYTFLSIFFTYLFMLPFLIIKKRLSKKLNMSKKLYDLNNNDKMEISFEEFLVIVTIDGVVSNELYYSDIVAIKEYEDIIIIISKKFENSIFINKKYGEQLNKILKKLDLMDLVENNAF